MKTWLSEDRDHCLVRAYTMLELRYYGCIKDRERKKSLLEYHRSLRAEKQVLYRIKLSLKTVSLVMLSIHFFIYRARKL